MQDNCEIEFSFAKRIEGSQKFFPLAVIRQEQIEVRIALEKRHSFVMCKDRDMRVRISFSNSSNERSRHHRVADRRGADKEDSHASLNDKLRVKTQNLFFGWG